MKRIFIRDYPKITLLNPPSPVPARFRASLPLSKGGMSSPLVIFFLSKTGKRGAKGDFHRSHILTVMKDCIRKKYYHLIVILSISFCNPCNLIRVLGWRSFLIWFGAFIGR